MNQVKAGAALNYVIIGLNILTGLLYTPYMLRCLGQNEYGLYSLVASVIAYLTLLDFGFGSAIVRYTAKIRATGTKQDEWRLYGMFLTAYTVMGLLVTIAGIVLYFNVDAMFDRSMTPAEVSQAKVMMGLMVFNLAVTFPFSVFGSIISAYEHFVFQRVLSITRILLSTAVMIGVLAIGYKAIAMVIVQTVFSIGTLAANLIYCRYRLHIKIDFGHFNIPLLKEILVFSWWNFLGAIVDRIYWSTGQFILGIYCGTVAVAIFSVAITLNTLFVSMSTSFNSVLLPRITVLATDERNNREISNLFIKTGRLQFCVLCMILCGFSVFGQQFIIIWAGSDYYLSYFVSLIFFFSVLCPLIQNVGLTILLARGQQKFRSVSYLIIAGFSLAGQIYVAPRYGVLGCAWVIAIAHFVGQGIIMNLYYVKRQKLDIKRFWEQILHMAIGPAILTALSFVVYRHFDMQNWWNLGVGILMFLMIYLPVFYIFSMNRYERETLLTPFKAISSRVGLMK